MEYHLQNLEFQQVACGTLAELSYNNNDNKITIVLLGILDSLRDTLVTHFQNLKVQQKALCAVRNLANSPQSKILVGKALLQTIKHSMTLHLLDVKLQRRYV
jgi:hypothetical protein